MSQPLGYCETGAFADLERHAANANSDLIEHAMKMGYLFGENEYTFLKETMRKRKLSEKQLAWKVKINRRIVSQTVVVKRTVR